MPADESNRDPAADLAEEAALCRAASAGDDLALQRLLAAVQRRLTGFVQRRIGVQWQGKIDAEDILQDAYIECHRSIASFQPQGPDSFYHWLSRIADHRFFNRVRALQTQKRSVAREQTMRADHSAAFDALVDRCAGASDSPTRLLNIEDARSALRSCLAQLPEDRRIAIQRIYLDEVEIRIVAGELGRSEDALRRLAGRALEQLQECLGRASRYLSAAG